MKIKLTSVMVDDQERAASFYCEVLGFKKKEDIPMGEHRWLTVVSPEGPDDVELLLEPMSFPPAKTYQNALFDAGIPLTAFAVDNVEHEHERLTGLGVVFKTPPTPAGPTTVASYPTPAASAAHAARSVRSRSTSPASCAHSASAMSRPAGPRPSSDSAGGCGRRF